MPAILNKWGYLPIGLKWTNFEIFQQYPVQNQYSKRVYFMEKLKSHEFMVIWGRPILLNTCLPTSPICPIKFFIILNLKYIIILGLFNVKSLGLSFNFRLIPCQMAEIA